MTDNACTICGSRIYKGTPKRSSLVPPSLRRAAANQTCNDCLGTKEGAPPPQSTGTNTAPVFETFLESEIVQIIVGADDSDKVTFMVHKDLIAAKIPYFEGCFRGKLEEARTKQVRLEDCPKAFQQILKWVYTGTVRMPPREHYQRAEILIDAYIIADRFCAEALKNHIVDTFRKWCHDTHARTRLLRRFRQAELGDSPLRAFLLTNMAASIRSRGYETFVQKIDPGLPAFIREGAEDAEALFKEVATYDPTPGEFAPA